MDIKEFSNFGFYSGVKAEVKNKGFLNGTKIINIVQADFEFNTIYDENKTEYKLDEIVRFVPAYCSHCGVSHHPGENTLCDKKYRDIAK